MLDMLAHGSEAKVTDALSAFGVPAADVRSLLSEPSFNGFHEVVSQLCSNTGFGRGLYTADERRGGQQTAEAQRLYCAKIIGLVGVSIGDALEPSPIVDAVLQVPNASARPMSDFLLSRANVAGRAAAEAPSAPSSARLAPETPSAPSCARPATSSSGSASARRTSAVGAGATTLAGEGGASWRCVHCGHVHEESLPYCEMCAKVRGTPKGGSGAAREGPVRLVNTAMGERPSSASSTGSLRSDGGRASGGRARSGTSTGSTASGSRSGSVSSGSASRGRGFGGAGVYRVPGYGPPAAGTRRPTRRPEPDPDRGLKDDDENDELYDEMLAGRWSRYKSDQKKREEARREAEVAHEKRRAEANAEKERLRKGSAPPTSAAQSAAAAASDDAAWERFIGSGSESPISVTDVPWPTLQAGALGLDPATASAAERKQAFRAKSLRWHPDKFVQVFGSRLDPEEREAILRRVTEVSQEINALYQAAEEGAR